jgi:hypothetical protein
MMATVAAPAGEWLDRVREAYRLDGYFDSVWEELIGVAEAEETSTERHQQRRDRAKRSLLQTRRRDENETGRTPSRNPENDREMSRQNENCPHAVFLEN